MDGGASALTTTTEDPFLRELAALDALIVASGTHRQAMGYVLRGRDWHFCCCWATTAAQAGHGYREEHVTKALATVIEARDAQIAAIVAVSIEIEEERKKKGKKKGTRRQGIEMPGELDAPIYRSTLRVCIEKIRQRR